MTQEGKFKEAKRIYETANADQKYVLETLFPELKEGEDEYMRKALIKFTHENQYIYTTYNGRKITKEEFIMWLEKQGEQSNANKEYWRGYREGKQEVLDKYSELEKQGEQKPADKVESKFHEGDWAVYDGWHCQITEVREDGYCNDHNGFIPKNREDDMRLWTIQDAKDGDVLASNRSTFIFSQEYMARKPEAHCGIMNGLFIVKPEGCWTNEKCYPATKEQRETLFKVMHEAGYEWDAEKKELREIGQNFSEYEKPLLEKFKKAVYDCAWGKVTCKKEGETKEEYANRWAEHFLLMVRDWADDYIDFTIQQKLYNSYEKGKADIIEQKPAWSEEDKEMLDGIIVDVEVLKEQDRTKDGKAAYQKEIDWLKNLKDRVQLQPKQEWNEENDDEAWLNDIICKVESDCTLNKDEKDWLKSLKDRMQPKLEWSEEDEVKINRIVACLENLNVADNDILLKDVDWLKSLRPQPKQEWSQNDIEMVDWLIRSCEKEHEELCNDKYGHQDIVSDLKRDCRKKWDWLESLKNRVIPKNQWKPSDEQIKAIQTAIGIVGELTPTSMLLKELREQLNKL